MGALRFSDFGWLSPNDKAQLPAELARPLRKQRE
jgi:hypothetical protein